MKKHMDSTTIRRAHKAVQAAERQVARAVQARAQIIRDARAEMRLKDIAAILGVSAQRAGQMEQQGRQP